MYDYITKEQAITMANDARKIAMIFAAKIYEYIAGDISIEELQAIVPEYIKPEFEQILYHKIIKKDYLGNTWDIDNII